MGIVDSTVRIDDTPGTGRAIDQVELVPERDHDDAAVIGDVNVDDTAGRSPRALATGLFRLGEALVAGAEQVGDRRERLDCTGTGLELVQVGSEVTPRGATEKDRAVARDRERGRAAEGEVER